MYIKKKIRAIILLATVVLCAFWAGRSMLLTEEERKEFKDRTLNSENRAREQPAPGKHHNTISDGNPLPIAPAASRMGGPLMAAQGFDLRTSLLNERSLEFLDISSEQMEAINKLIREVQEVIAEKEMKAARIEKEDGNRLIITYESAAGNDAYLKNLTEKIKTIVPDNTAELIHSALAYSSDFHSFSPGGAIRVSWNDGQFTFLMEDEIRTELRYKKWSADKGILEEDISNFPRWAHIPRLFDAPVRD